VRLWLLGVTESGERIKPRYDVFDGWVVRAPSEREAREIAQSRGGDEVGSYFDKDNRHFWTDPDLTTCVPLTEDGAAGAVLGSFNAG